LVGVIGDEREPLLGVVVRDPIGRLACAFALALTCGRAGIAPYRRSTAGTAGEPGDAMPGESGRAWVRREARSDPQDLELQWLLIVIGIGRRHRAFPVDGFAPTTTG
jgi:hypothetical protein